MPRKNAHIGSDFDSFLEEEGLLAEVIAGAAKRNLVDQLEAVRQKQGLTKSALAKKAGISRMQLDRVLDPDNLAASLKVIAKVAAALGKGVYFKLV